MIFDFSTTVETVFTNDVITVFVETTESLANAVVALKTFSDSSSVNDVFVVVMLSSLLQIFVAVEIF